MAENSKDDFDFEVESEDIDNIEVEDDTPAEDRNRTPMPKELVEKLDLDELEDYSEEVKTKLKQLKKVWHDERRAKEAAFREQQEAISLAQRLVNENQQLKSTLNQGEQTLVSTYRQAVELELANAKKAYKEAYESGDSDQLLEAQQQLNNASYKLQQVSNYRPRPVEVDNSYNIPQNTRQVPTPDEKTLNWQRNNPWWGNDSEMTASALGLHEKLSREYGASFVGTDEYWERIDDTMRRRFPEYFQASGTQKSSGRGNRSGNVVAPASRSTSSKKIVLKQSQLNIAKRLGLTPEQYAREYAKTLEK